MSTLAQSIIEAEKRFVEKRDKLAALLEKSTTTIPTKIWKRGKANDRHRKEQKLDVLRESEKHLGAQQRRPRALVTTAPTAGERLDRALARRAVQRRGEKARAARSLLSRGRCDWSRIANASRSTRFVARVTATTSRRAPCSIGKCARKRSRDDDRHRMGSRARPANRRRLHGKRSCRNRSFRASRRWAFRSRSVVTARSSSRRGRARQRSRARSSVKVCRSPSVKALFTSQTLTPKKMAVITTWTREIDEHSIPAIEGLLRDAIASDTAISLDAILLDTNPATAIRPAGILNGVSRPDANGGRRLQRADRRYQATHRRVAHRHARQRPQSGLADEPATGQQRRALSQHPARACSRSATRSAAGHWAAGRSSIPARCRSAR